VRLIIVAVGQRVPDWAQAAWSDYVKRFPPELKIELKAIKTEPRTNNKNTAALMLAERERIEAAIEKESKGTRVVVLDERGKNTSTTQLAARLTDWPSSLAGLMASTQNSKSPHMRSFAYPT
jgi:23S rRNA (pseudouridine1915-N3)-methyltransferase